MAVNSHQNVELVSDDITLGKPWKRLVPWAFMTEMSCMGPRLLETNDYLIATLESTFHKIMGLRVSAITKY